MSLCVSKSQRAVLLSSVHRSASTAAAVTTAQRLLYCAVPAAHLACVACLQASAPAIT
jgi:hypothetical protein